MWADRSQPGWLIHNIRLFQNNPTHTLLRVFGNLRGKQDIWWYFGDGTTKTTPYLPLTTTILRETLFYLEIQS